MENVVLTIHLLLALALIALVLLQRSEGGALGIGGGGPGGMMSGRGAANLLTRVTMILGALFIGNSILLAIISGVTTSSGSVLDRVGETQTNSDLPFGDLEGLETDVPAPTDEAPADPAPASDDAPAQDEPAQDPDLPN